MVVMVVEVLNLMAVEVEVKPLELLYPMVVGVKGDENLSLETR